MEADVRGRKIRPAVIENVPENFSPFAPELFASSCGETLAFDEHVHTYSCEARS